MDIFEILKPKITADDIVSLLKGAAIAGIGALCVAFTQGIGGLNFGVWQGLAVAVASILVNIVRKWFGIK